MSQLATIGKHVGNNAIWNSELCSVNGMNGRKTSIGDSFTSLSSTYFDEAILPMIDLPGLLQAYISNTEAGIEPRDLAEVNLFERKYQDFLRGEDWQCGCSTSGGTVVCSQLYTLIRCPISADTIDECCFEVPEEVPCQMGLETCATEIRSFTHQRRLHYNEMGYKVSIAPRAAFESYEPLYETFEPGQGLNIKLPQCSSDRVDWTIKAETETETSSTATTTMRHGRGAVVSMMLACTVLSMVNASI